MSDKEQTPQNIEEKSGDSTKESVNKTARENKLVKEIGGREGPEPTRYGDWEKNGIISDF